MKFGDRVRQLRRGKRMTQEQLAERVGVHLNTVNRWENLIDPIDDITKLVNLSHELGTTVAYLRGESENAEGDPMRLNAGESVEIRPKIEKLGDGHVFYYEYNGQKVEMPARQEFIDLFINMTREIRNSGQNTLQSSITVNNQAQAKDSANALVVA